MLRRSLILLIAIGALLAVTFGVRQSRSPGESPDHIAADLVQERDGLCSFQYETSPLEKLLAFVRRRQAEERQLVATISVRTCRIVPGDAAVIARCRALQGIDLSYTACDDDFLDALGRHPRLERVEVEATSVTDAGVIRLLRRCPAISGLDLSDTPVTDKVLYELAKQGRISELHVAGTAITDQAIIALCRACPTITYLDLRVTGITDAALAAIATLPNLDILYLDATNTTDAGLAHLAARSISTIHLSATGITSAGVARLRREGIEDLDLEGTDIDDTVIDHILKMPDLQYLYLAHCRITDAGALRLARLKQLEALDVTGSSISQSTLDILKRALPHALAKRVVVMPGSDENAPAWYQRLQQRILERRADQP